jgi:spore maturation protein CgeB
LSCAPTRSNLLLVGYQDVVHVGAHLSAAAYELAYPVTHLDSRAAFAGKDLIRKLHWHLRGHRPSRLGEFSECVVETCRQQRPQWMLATGLAPIEAAALRDVGRLGTIRVNYLTDDPWNPSHRAPWFMDAMRQYDWIFSTRTANVEDLERHGCSRVAYLPFGYTPALHYADPPGTSQEQERFAADIVFAGGADPDRIPLMARLIREGFNLALYGGYWDRYSETKHMARGHADPATLRKALRGAKVALCLVRRANRDGSAMRTFEVAAIGACTLAEYTPEHRQILGEDGEAVVYFRSPEEMVSRLRWLLAHEEERHRLGVAVRARITSGRNTYKDRLETMLTLATASRV